MTDKTKSIIVTVLKYIGAIIAGVLGTLGVTSCGVTRASIVQPKDNSATTITITTNNPITTTVDPNTSATYNPK